ncbi:MAG: hypothetical protein IT341_10455 [Chloroflexi bacterium]|nr:hypothetical protein [Chloroflexota bacterium]
MTVAVGTAPNTCHHAATGPECGLCVGERTRAAAAAAGVPVAYWIRIQEQGWGWARFRDAVHLVHPAHDRSECGRLVPRAVRTTVTTGIAAAACDGCWRRVLGDTPRRSR